MIYQLGVCHALQQHDIELEKNTHFIGSSGGAACCAALALNIDSQSLADFLLHCCADYHSDRLHNTFAVRNYIKASFERSVEENTFQHQAILDGRLNVVISLVPSMKEVVVNSFSDNEEFINVCLASCTATPFGGFPLKLNSTNPDINGKFAMDGAVTNMLPVMSPKTIRITPLYFLDADIKPSRYVPLHWGLFPPSVEKMRELFWLGVKDATTWLTEMGYKPLQSDSHPSRTRKLAIIRNSKVYPTLPRVEIGSPLSDMLITDINRFIPNSVLSFGRNDLVMGFPHLNKNSYLPGVILKDGQSGGEAMTLASESVHRVGDSLAVIMLIASVKPIALSVVYTELTSKAVLSAATGIYVSMEKKKKRTSATKKRYAVDASLGARRYGRLYCRVYGIS